MERVVVTGMGGISSIGRGLAEIRRALASGTSGITLVEEWRDLGMASQIGGLCSSDPDLACPIITRKEEKTSTENALMALQATWEALQGARLTPSDVRGTRLAVLIGSGTGSTLRNYFSSTALMQFRTSRKVHPYTVPHVMGSTASANVSTALGVRGESWSVSSACSTGAHAIGLAALLIRFGRYEQVLAGASEEIDWTHAGAFDAMHALSRGFNADPTRASRPYDRARDGFVISGGAGILLLESLRCAERRGAPIYGEIVGFGASSDGHDMVAPFPGGAEDTMRLALADAGLAPEDVEYVNAHGTSTPQGDVSEAAAMRAVFGDRQPWISSTKSMTGHAIAAAGSLEVIYTLLMMQHAFLAPNINLDDVDDACRHLRLVATAETGFSPRIALSNSFGFGGTNACIAIRRWDGP